MGALFSKKQRHDLQKQEYKYHKHEPEKHVKQPEKYSVITEKYQCAACNSYDVTATTIYDNNTEPYPPLNDKRNNLHYHDETKGHAHVKCINGHVTTIPLVNRCTCGWTSDGGQSCEQF